MPIPASIGNWQLALPALAAGFFMAWLRIVAMPAPLHQTNHRTGTVRVAEAARLIREVIYEHRNR